MAGKSSSLPFAPSDARAMNSSAVAVLLPGEVFDMSQVGLQIITGQLPVAEANDRWFVQSSYVVGVLEIPEEGSK